MKKIIKAIALMLAITVLAGTATLSALADGGEEGATAVVTSAGPDGSITVSLRIEGVEECVYYNKAVQIPAGFSVADLMQAANDLEDAPEITVIETAYGPYLTKIGDLEEFDYGETSGWLFTHNGEKAEVGAGDTLLSDGDAVVYFYAGNYGGGGFQYPKADMSGFKSDGIIKFTSEDTEYDENWDATTTTNPVAGATVTLGGAEYITDENGEIHIADTNGAAGLCLLQIARFSEEEEYVLPTVLRFAPDYSIYIRFADVPADAWYNEAVEYCALEGLFIGVDAQQGLLAPLKQLSLAELCTVLARISAVDLSKQTDPWYQTALVWADENGVLDVDLDTDDDVAEDNVTRETFIYMFYTTIAMLESHDMTLRADIESALDYDDVAGEYADAISWAVASGIIKGTDADNLVVSPKVEVNRATVCQMLYNYYN